MTPYIPQGARTGVPDVPNWPNPGVGHLSQMSLVGTGVLVCAYAIYPSRCANRRPRCPELAKPKALDICPSVLDGHRREVCVTPYIPQDARTGVPDVPNCLYISWVYDSSTHPSPPNPPLPQGERGEKEILPTSWKMGIRGICV